MTLFADCPAKRRAWAPWFLPGQSGAELIDCPIRPRQNRWPGGGRLASSALASAALAALVSMPMRGVKSVDGPAASARGPAASWVDIQKPFQLYTLPSPEFGKAPSLYEARRLAVGEGRIDTLVFGKFDGTSSYLRVSIQRLAEPGPASGFFIDLARRAAEAGLAVSHPSVTAQIASSFGGLDFASATLEHGGTQARCQLFRLSDSGPDLHVAGLACAGGGRELEPSGLACLIDRLSLISARDDAALRLFFAAADLKRDHFCAISKHLAADRPVASLVAEPAPEPLPPKPAAVPKPHVKKTP